MNVIERLIPRHFHGYEKAVAPALFGLIGTVVTALSAGHLDALQMEVALVAFLAASASFLVDNAPDGWERFAKAIVPATLTVLGVLVHALVTGDWGDAEWTAAITGLVSAAITYLVPNAPEPIALEALYDDDDLPTDEEEFETTDIDGAHTVAEGTPPAPGEYTPSAPIMPSQDEHEARS